MRSVKWGLKKNPESKWIGPSVYQVTLWDPEAETEAEAGAVAGAEAGAADASAGPQPHRLRHLVVLPIT